MKKVLCLFGLCVLFVATQSFAQSKTQFGLKGGLNLAKISIFDLGDAKQKQLLSFHLGGVMNYTVAENFVIETGLLLSGKGTKLETFGSTAEVSITGKLSAAPFYLEVPINAVYKVQLSSMNLRLFAGPYLAFGVAGNIKEKYSATGLPAGVTLGSIGLDDATTKIKFGTNEDGDWRPLDFGLNIGAGIELNNLLFAAQYGLGLSNVEPVNWSENESKNRVISISVGYMLSGK